MRRIKPIIILIIAFLYGCSESMDSFYSNYNDVISDNAIGRGWIPNEIPKSATDIFEWHNLDTNIGCGSFSFEKIEKDSFLQKLKLVNNKDDISVKCINLRGEWHNSSSINGIKQLLAEGYILYRSMKFYFAVNTKNCTAYFWNMYSIKVI